MSEKWLDPKEAVRLLDEDPAQVIFPLDYFIDRFGLTYDQVHAELCAGRLVAAGPLRKLRRLRKTGGGIPLGEFTISAARLIDWIANPETPPHLIEAYHNAMRRNA